MKRGEVWWAKLDKRRPVVLVSRQDAYAVRALVIVALGLEG
jgi:mRNA-degrading endonuclease toxin of MazEF toxin-antitoxin module